MTDTRKSRSTAARKAAAAGEPIVFEFEGDEYQVPPSEQWDVELLEAFEEHRYVFMVRTLLGADQYARWKATGPGGRRTIADFDEFMNAINGVLGSPNS